MSREDANGETFEIIDKRFEELTTAESISSMSSSASLLPSPGVSISSVPSGGNVLSNIQPPAALPSFIAQQPVTSPVRNIDPHPITTSNSESTTSVLNMPLVSSMVQQSTTNDVIQGKHSMEIPTACEAFYPTQFSAAIPPSKGIKHGMEHIPIATATPVGDNGGFIEWMRGAVASGGILSKVAEKAKNSVDSIITTLDPQMQEFICMDSKLTAETFSKTCVFIPDSGGDIEVVVASKQEVKVSAVREAFQSVFGKATIGGIEAQSSNIAVQPVGFASAVKAAEERIQAVLANPKLPHPLPVVAIENFLLEVGEDKWYDLGVLILNDPIKQISLQTFTQMTPVPAEIVALAQEDTPTDYPLRWSGLSVTVGSLMGSNLHVPHSEWHHALTGVTRREIILQAAKVLATLYKNSSGLP